MAFCIEEQAVAMMAAQCSEILHCFNCTHGRCEGLVKESVAGRTEEAARRNVRITGDKSTVIDREGLSVFSAQGSDVDHSSSRRPDECATLVTVELCTGKADHLSKGVNAGGLTEIPSVLQRSKIRN